MHYVTQKLHVTNNPTQHVDYIDNFNYVTIEWEYLKTHPEFEIKKSIDHKFMISVAPDGYLKRVK